MDREEALARISERIGSRKLVWFGDIGEDCRGLLELPQYSHCYCTVAAPVREGLRVLSLEDLTDRRSPEGEMPPLTGPLSAQVYAWLQSAIGEPCLVMNRTPLGIMATIQALSPHVEYIGASFQMYRALGDKIAVEAALRDEPALKLIPYEELAPGASRLDVLKSKLADGPVVLRRSYSSSGHGHELIRDEQDLAASVIAGVDEPISAGPFLGDFYTVSVGACVFPDGEVTQHHPGIVVSGQPVFGREAFAWGGTDFDVSARISATSLEKYEAGVRAAGRWLHSQGYRGAFNFEALLNDEDCYFLEINPRFDGRSRVSAALDDAMGRANVLLDHLMAWLDIESYRTTPLAEQALNQPKHSFVVLRNQTESLVRRKPGTVELPESFSATLLPPEGRPVEPHGILCSLISPQSISTAPRTLNPSALQAAKAVLVRFEPVDATQGT